jgi:hypothetical protein
MSRTLSRLRRCAAAIACVLTLSTSAAAGDAERAEIEALKNEIAELKRSDAAKQKQLDQMMEILRELRPQAVAKKAAPSAPAPAPAQSAVAAPAQAPKSALDAALERSDGETAPVASAPATPPTDTSVGKLEIPTRGPAPPTWLARPVPGATLRLLEPSMNIITAVGGSTVPDEDIAKLEGGAHDPKRRGFTLQEAELSLFGAVDPYFNGEAHFVFTEDGVETEEAFATTTSLPWNLQVKAGYFLTDFGRINPTHPHAWPWVDQPVINTRMFGGDGLRSAGAQVNYLLPLPFYSELVLGVQNANNGGLTPSFFVPVGETTVGGRPSVNDSVANMEDLLYLTRSATAFNVSDDWAGLIGFSGLFGPNSTGPDAPTFIYGADLTLKWRPADNFRGWPFLVWQSEVMKRDFTADPFVAPVVEDEEHAEAELLGFGPGRVQHADHGGHDHGGGGEPGEFDENLPGSILRDWGFYTQLLYGFHYRWAAGIRYEFADSDGQSVGGTTNDYLRDARHRVSPLLLFNPTEFSRLRLQYNYDNATFLPDSNASSIWMSLEILFGTHPAHQY